MLVTLIAVLLLVAPVQDEKKFPDNSEHLKELSWLIGTWEGAGEAEGFGKYTDTYVYEWALNKNFIKANYKLKVGGKVVYHDQSMLGYDVEKKTLKTFTFGMDGGIGWAEQKDSEEKNVYKWEGKVAGPNHSGEFRAFLTKVDDDNIQLLIQHKMGDEWGKDEKQTYKRKK